MWGREFAEQMLGEACFGGVEVLALDHDIMNYWYVSRISSTNGASAYT